jgi:anti-sigma-K factor RskA
MKAKTDDLVTRFLLGELSEEERVEVEQRFLADNEFFEQVLSAEDALVDQYVLNQLGEKERMRAKAFLESSTGQRQMVESTRELLALLRESRLKKTQGTTAAKPTPVIEQTNNLHAETETASTHPRPARSTTELHLDPANFRSTPARFTLTRSLVVALVFFSLAASIIYVYSQRKAWEVRRIAQEQNSKDMSEMLRAATERNAKLGVQLEIERQKRVASEELVSQLRLRTGVKISSILLAPTTHVRGGDSKIQSLKPGGRPIQIRLDLDKAWRYSRYNMLITTFDGRKVWSVDSLDSSQIKRRKLTVVVPPSLLKPEDYRIVLTGLSDRGDYVHVADYAFKVRK